MYFRAEQKGIQYEINVNETRAEWKIRMRKENEDWRDYNFPKNTFSQIDDAVNFIFLNSSYVLDCIGSGTDYAVYARGSYRVIKIFNDEMLLHESLKQDSALADTNKLTAGMPGKIIKVFVTDGQKVEKGNSLVIIEAMKMENEIKASRAATVTKVFVKQGDVVEAGGPLISFDQ